MLLLIKNIEENLIDIPMVKKSVRLFISSSRLRNFQRILLIIFSIFSVFFFLNLYSKFQEGRKNSFKFIRL